MTDVRTTRDAARTRGAILHAARATFETHGFHGGTIRAIASTAGVSPSLVIKTFGTKSALYAESGASAVPIDGLDVPPAQIGTALVRRIVQRRLDGVDEPWSKPGLTIRQAEDPEAERSRLRASWLAWLGDLIHDPTPEREHAMMIGCLLAGLAEGLNTIRFTEDEAMLEQLGERYARLVQGEIDRIRRP